MSSLQDIFAKEAEVVRILDYDDCAFYHFAAVFLIMMILPLLWNFFKYKVFHISDNNIPSKNLSKAKSCGCSLCQKKKTAKHHSQSHFGISGLLQLSVLLVLVCLLMLTCQCIQNSPEGIKVFDPYKILGLPVGATNKQIKSAYRGLSRIFMPDKIRTNHYFVQIEFINRSNAYDILTDDIAWENYQKYGNPDGPYPSKFAIGLPRLLLKTENHISVLVVFFTAIIILIPGTVILWMNTSNRLDKNQIFQDNQSFYYKYLNDELNVNRCLMMIAESLDFEGTKVHAIDSYELNAIDRYELNKFRDKYPDILSEMDNEMSRVKVVSILLAYLDRSEIPLSIKKDLDNILSLSENYIESMINIAANSDIVLRKRMNSQIFIKLLEVSQILTQGIPPNRDNLLMIPHIQKSTIELINSNNVSKLSDISEHFGKLADELSPEAMQDIQEAYRYFPKLSVRTEAYVEGEEEIAVGDIVTIKVTVERTQLQDGQTVGPIHSNTFPYSKFEKIWILFIEPESGKLLHLTSVFSLEKVIEYDNFKFLIGPDGIDILPGRQEWEVHVKSDSYYGLDVVCTTEFEVLCVPSKERDIFIHPDDQNIESPTSWIYSLVKIMHENSCKEQIPELF